MLRKLSGKEHTIDLVLDDLDRRILYFWDLDARRSASEIAKLVKSSKETVNFRMNKLVKDKIVTSFMTEVDNAALGYSNIKVYLKFKNFSNEIEKGFVDYLASIKEVCWIVQASGRWDILFGFWATSTFAFHTTLIDILNKFGKYIHEKEIIHNINWHYYNRKWLLKQYAAPIAITYGGEPRKCALDKLDFDMLKLMATNGRMPVVELANKLGQSSQNIINRMRKLEQDKIITKYSLNINYQKIGYIFCKAFIFMENITRDRLEELKSYCANQQNIFALTTTCGAWDLELEFEVEDFEQMRNIMDDMRLKFSDIMVNYDSIIILKQVTPRYLI